MTKTKNKEQAMEEANDAALTTCFHNLTSDVLWMERMAKAGRILYNSRSSAETAHYWGALQIHYNNILVWLLNRSGVSTSTLCTNTPDNMCAAIKRMGKNAEDWARCIVSGKLDTYDSSVPLMLFNDETMNVSSVSVSSNLYWMLLAVMQLGFAFNAQTLKTLEDYNASWYKAGNGGKDASK